MTYIDIVFDGPPDHVAPRFIEVEDAGGRSISIGEWLQRPDGLWTLRIKAEDVASGRDGTSAASADAPPLSKGSPHERK